ncbi:MAG: triose-phosphate isomerase [Mesorhizobium sp.]|uniref:triose-phosphate isomerase n=2 Tax=Mesorhizobium sp. TaxID=1871066 RepID=UPI000FE7A8CA|nr:triose-phosphate isomerase [Mesorhizobium sp.]RWD53616.1 MAG: triose-phosphate isomerase [Mesorhizobium sp.]RWE63699.1 MAG: triose-phosphate isomerase [Mesorhizobium sp.]RWF12504.1 MAG: triose-phosphate isomerase [Mesorhizobium sp.]
MEQALEGGCVVYWVGTSWKMNKTLAEATDFIKALAGFVPGFDDRIQPFVIPPFTAAREVKKALATTRVKVGAQNMHWADAGAWTGEISPVMLTDCGLDLVELGHSERREHFGETDNAVGLKAAAAVKHGLVPLICVGETLAQRNSGEADAVLALQVHGALKVLEGEAKAATILFAYEPVWAIGDKGIPASADYADRQQALIKKIAGELLPAVPPVLYGGSVNPQNAAELIGQPHIDGLFIGRSAWQAEGYIDILQRASAAI